jgi:hypothetical protein
MKCPASASIETVAWDVLPFDRNQLASCAAVTRLRPMTGVVLVAAGAAGAAEAGAIDPSAVTATTAMADRAKPARRRWVRGAMDPHRRGRENLKE